MGNQLGKSSRTTTTTTTSKTNGQSNGFETNLQKMKKKRDKTSSFNKVDKSTETDNTFLFSSSTLKHLVGHPAPHIYDTRSYETSSARFNGSETPSKDVLELRDACFRRGLIAPEYGLVCQSNLNEENLETPSPVQEETSETPVNPPVEENPTSVPVTDIDEETSNQS